MQKQIDLDRIIQTSPVTLPLAAVRNMLPARLHDRYWPPCLLIFLADRHLKSFIADYFDFEREEIDIAGFNQMVKPFLSSSQRFLVSLAFHLFSADNPLPDDGLIGLRLLDDHNYRVALAAIRLAYDRGPDHLAPKEDIHHGRHRLSNL